MLKKFHWCTLAVVILLCCSPLWANYDNPWSEYIYAAADQKQPASVNSVSHSVSANPLDLCSNTNTCFLPPAVPCALPGSLIPGMEIWTFQDPAKACPPPHCATYPFQVKAVHVMLTNCGPAPCIAVLMPRIWSAIYPTPTCPTPGTVLCQGIEQQVQIFPNQCLEIVLALPTNCCVETSYFASVQIVSTDCPNLQVCVDHDCTPCCDYIQFLGGQPVDACAQGSPGDFALWTDGAMSCQNNCPQLTENCCYPFAGGPPCGPVPVGTCVPSGGVVVLVCLGDANGNGIDDACEPTTIDTLRDHFKTWRIFTPSKDTFALVRDQFTIHDFLFVDSIDFLSNPVRKIVFNATGSDTSDITRPDDHLTWYRVKSSNHRRIDVQVTYVNQFESTKVFIDTVNYFLLPTQKLFPPHPAPDSLLGHYTAYRIYKPKGFRRQVQLEDQFDRLTGVVEPIDSLVPVYFLTPADKNNELRPKSDTHYVAYRIFPQRIANITSQTVDQWGSHPLQVRNSEYLLVPTHKVGFVVCTHKPNDCTGDGKIDLADIVCDVNVIFKGFPKPVPNCRCDANCDNVCNLVDIVYKKNYVFGGGPEPIPCKECCIPVKRVP